MELHIRLASLLTLDNSTEGKAVFLDGPWGCGKTYTWNKVKEQLNENPPIYISLFGAKDKNDIKKKLDTALIGGSDSDSLFGKARKLSSRFNIKKLLEEKFSFQVDIDVFELFTGRKIVCFDDLERVSNNGDIKDILGYINYLVEHKNFRCLIVLNSAEMAPNHLEDYHKFREKLSPLTIKFQLDDSLEAILSSMMLDSIKQLMPDVLYFAKEFKLHNLRTLKAIIDILADIYNATKKIAPQSAVRFLFSILIDRADGNERTAEFFNINYYVIFSSQEDEEKKEKHKSQTEYWERFFKREEDYAPYNSLIRLVYDGDLDEAALTADLFLVDQPDETTKKILEMREAHLFFKTDLELQNYMSEINRISYLDRNFKFEEVASLIKLHSSCINLLELPIPSSIPSKLKTLAVETLKNHRDIHDLERSYGHSREQIISKYLEELKTCVEQEIVRRYTEHLDQAIRECHSEKVRSALSYKGSIAVGCSGKVQTMWPNQSNLEKRYDLVSMIINCLNDLLSRHPEYIHELTSLSDFLLTEHSQCTDKMSRLRLFRLLEQAKILLPVARPRGLIPRF